MEYNGRRNRRGRDRRSRPRMVPQNFVPTNSRKRWSVLDGFNSLFIMTSLVAIVYLLLDYHCTVCNTKCNLGNITRNIDNIANNISIMKDSYYDLETKILKFSHEVPRIEGQIEILEAIANSMGGGDFRNPERVSMTNFDVYITQEKSNDNRTSLDTSLPKSKKVDQD